MMKKHLSSLYIFMPIMLFLFGLLLPSAAFCADTETTSKQTNMEKAGCTSALDDLRCLSASLKDFGANLNDIYEEYLTNKGIGRCPTCSETLDSHLNNNWSYALFSKILKAINVFGTELFNLISAGSIRFLIVALALWLAVQIGKHLMAFSPQDPFDFWTKTGRVLFKAMFAGALLVQPVGTLSGLIISPIVVGATEFTLAVFKSYTNVGAFEMQFKENNEKLEQLTKDMEALRKDAASLRETADSETGLGVALSPISVLGGIAAIDGLRNTTAAYYKDVEADKLETQIKTLQHSEVDTYYTACNAWMPASKSKADIEAWEKETEDTANILNKQVRGALLCMIESIHNEVAFGMALGSQIICESWTAYFWGLFSLPNIPMLVCGVVIWLTCFLISIMFVFKLLDAVIRLAIICALLPFLIIAWVFPPTVSYAKQGLKILLYICIILIVMAIVLAICILCVIYAFGGMDSTLVQAFVTNDVQSLRENLDLSGTNFLLALLFCLFAIKLVGVVDKTASEIALPSDEDGFGTSAGDKVGVMGAFVAAHTAQAAATLVGAGVAMAAHNPKGGQRAASSNTTTSNNTTPPPTSSLNSHQQGVLDNVLFNSNGKFNKEGAEMMRKTDDEFNAVKSAQHNMSDIVRNQAVMGTVVPGAPLTPAQDAANNYLRAHKQEVDLLKQYAPLVPLQTQAEREKAFSDKMRDFENARNEVPDAKDRRDYVNKQEKYAKDNGLY